MKTELVAVKLEEKEILRNLLEKYLYEFSQYCDETLDSQGLIGYKYLDNYWQEEKRWPFFIKVDGKLAGFVLINDFPESGLVTDFTLAEFFVIYKYRREGIGSWVVGEIFKRFRGTWQLKYHPKNIISEAFWTKVVAAADSDFQLRTDLEEAMYDLNTQGQVLIFRTNN
ncbi:MAG: GNAT family N-acetyltransferase [Streptococcaceae bacterium]|jgi:predicted acetyltransferase|nr:GNAT family N-acetyltransferase [Streptococcaceae bacterium]